MKKTFTVLTVISLWILALVNFFENALEASFLVQLQAIGDTSGVLHRMETPLCTLILIGVAIICAALAVLSALKERKDTKNK